MRKKKKHKRNRNEKNQTRPISHYNPQCNASVFIFSNNQSPTQSQ